MVKSGDPSSEGSATGYEWLKLALAQHYRNLQELEARTAQDSLPEVPPQLANRIAAEKEQIGQLERRLLGRSDELSPAEQLFSAGMRAYLQGDLGEARHLLKLSLKAEPFYARAEQLLKEMKHQTADGEARRRSVTGGRRPFEVLIGTGLVVLVIITGWVGYRGGQLEVAARRGTTITAMVHGVTMTPQAEGTASAQVGVTATALAPELKGTATVIAASQSTEAAGAAAADAMEILLNCWPNCADISLHDADFRGIELSLAKLNGADLRGANLSGIDLSGADLTGANLRRANLNRTNLSGTNLSRANLSGADLSGADLRGADLSRADLWWSDLRESRINETTQIEAKWRLVWEIVNNGASQHNLSWADLRWADLRDVNLRGADLRGADLSVANLRGADLRGADLNRANLWWTDLKDSQIDETTQIEAKWRLVWEIANNRVSQRNLIGADLRGANLIGADLRGSNLSGTNLSWADLNGANLREADLSETNLNKTDLSGTRYNEGTRWPTGFDPAAAGAVRQ